MFGSEYDTLVGSYKPSNKAWVSEKFEVLLNYVTISFSRRILAHVVSGVKLEPISFKFREKGTLFFVRVSPVISCQTPR